MVSDQKMVSYKDFGRKHPRLDLETASKYHFTLDRLQGEGSKLSLKIRSCGLAGHRIDCVDDPTLVGVHSQYVPVMCDRRTCPECAYRDMIDRIEQFSPIAEIAQEYRDDKSWRVRFWTLTIKAAEPEADLRPYFQGLKKSLDALWKNLFGQNAQRDRPELKNAGGVFFMEVQGGWNPHLHGLVLSPFRRVEAIRERWRKAVKASGLEGDRIEIKLPYKKGENGLKRECKTKDDYHSAILEIVSYPIRPDKNGRHDQVLMAHVEHGLQGLRRYFTKGSWYHKFERPYHMALCAYNVGTDTEPVMCSSEFTHEATTDKFRPKMVQNLFLETEEGKRNFEKLGYKFPSTKLPWKQNWFKEQVEKDFPSGKSLL